MRMIFAAALLLSASAGVAQTPQFGVFPQPATLTVTAEGKVDRAPDVAQISGGVVTTAPTASAAMAENAQRMSAVVAAVRRAGVADRDIQTQGLSLSPQYRYDNNQPPVLTGYQASNTVSLRLRKLADAGRLLDTLVQVGANQLNGPTFSVDNTAAALDEARAAAVSQARSRADLYAKAAGVRIKRILSISESSDQPGPRPMLRAAMAMKAESATPVEPGEIALSVNVTMVFELE